MSNFRVLVVDDYAPFRRVVRLILQLRDDLQIVGEASDGMEALRLAKELRPHIVLMDIDLPYLNGIQAARRLSDALPGTKILFLSVESSSEVIREAFHAGASGYVYKLNVGSELLPALEALLRGKQFVGSGLEPEFRGAAPAATPAHRHEMLIYSDDAVFLESFSSITAGALRNGNPAVLIATRPQLDAVLQKLLTNGVDITTAEQNGILIAADVTQSLAHFMVNDLPDPVRHANAANDLIRIARKSANGAQRRITKCAVLAPVLWSEGKTDAAVWLERLSDKLAKEQPIDIFCAYPSSSFEDRRHERAFKNICAEHTAVYSH